MNQGCSGQAGVFGTEPEKESVIFVNPWTAGSTECPPPGRHVALDGSGWVELLYL